METLALAIVIIAAMAYNLANRWMDEKSILNNKSAEAELSVAMDELSNKFDSRINKAFENHQLIKTELDSLKLQIGFRNNNDRLK